MTAHWDLSPKTLARGRIMLLQGPVGPFFSELHSALTTQGFRVSRVLFNAGDALFSGHQECLRFTGS